MAAYSNKSRPPEKAALRRAPARAVSNSLSYARAAAGSRSVSPTSKPEQSSTAHDLKHVDNFGDDMTWLKLGWWCIEAYVRQHQMFAAAVLAHNISEMMTRPERQVAICKPLHASASQEFHLTLHDNLRAVDMKEFHVNIAHVLFTGYSVFMLASSGESVYRAASRVRITLAYVYNVLCGECRDITDDGALMARNVLRAMKERRPRLTVGGLFELRMSLVTGFVSLTATYLIIILQFNNVL
ncbi:hypothetical protein EVAR_62402_1 [Eumeta japonica]|uniref:Gustatory receptor n=1 Tax=Eumeta variegata TaxID=151549 RepID=A0A4C1Z8E3_EUMVA|nr:hypothetical protein EVAR_62402_1 [Eumeta japonica]